MDPFAIDGALARRMLDDHGVAISSSLGLDAAHDLSSDDTAVSREGETLLERAIDVVAEAGGQHLCGVIYSAMQKYMAPVTTERAARTPPRRSRRRRRPGCRSAASRSRSRSSTATRRTC